MSDNEAADHLRSRGLFAALLPAHSGQALAVSLMPPVIPMLAAYLGGGDSGDFSAQLISVVPFLGILTGGIASGWVMKRIGLRWFVLIAAGLFGVAGVMGLLATGPTMLLACGLIAGLASIFLMTGLSALTAIAYPVSARGKIIGMQAGMAGLVAIVFGLGCAFLAERFGWRVPYAIFIAFGVMIMMLTLAFIPVVALEQDHAPMAMSAILKHIWPIMIVGGVAFMLLISQATQLPFLMADKGLASPGQRGIVLSTLAAALMLSSIGFGFILPRIGERGVIVGIGCVGIVAWMTFGFWTGGLAWAIIGAALIGLAQGALIPLLFSNAMRVVRTEAGGAAVGLLNVALCIGSFMNPLLLSPVRSAVGLSGLMFVLAAITAIVLLLTLFWPTRTVQSMAHRVA